MAANGNEIAVLVIGRTKSGKSWYVENEILLTIFNNDPNRHIFIYDPQNEFRKYYPEKFEKIDLFLNRIKDNENSYIHIEEATTVFKNRSSNEILEDLLVSKRHKHNIISMCFHSFRAVPRYIFDLVDYVVILKTNDTEKVIREKIDLPEILEAVETVRNSDNPHIAEVINIYGK